jgi:hypothetical protein
VNIRSLTRNQIDTTKTVYLASPERMFSEYEGEKQNIKNYNGRQLLEMLQNADDAASEARDAKKALIQLTGNSLTIANTGYPFSEEGLRSIFHSHLSPKEAIENQIGKKGLGFRSILSWSDKIIVNSQGAAIAFSPTYSKELLDELLTHKGFLKKFNAINQKKITQPISTLVCPKVVQSKASSDIEGYDTIITLELKPKARPEVIDQIEKDLDAEVLLFLNNLDIIEIVVDGVRNSYHKSTENGTVTVKNINDGIIKTSVWNVESLKGRLDDIDLPYELSFAWEDSLTECKEHFYSFFRTKVPFKGKGILHGTFELNADRNLIIKDDEGYNKRLAEKIPELLLQCAKTMSLQAKTINYDPLSILDIQIEALNHIIDPAAILNQIKVGAKLLSIFPAISDKFIEWKNEPVYYDNETLLRNLSPTLFPDVLQWCTNDFCKSFLTGKYTYNIKDIMKDILSKRASISVREYAEIIYILHGLIKEGTDLGDSALLYDRYMNPLSFSSTIFFPDSSQKYEIPPEVSIQVIDEGLAGELSRVVNKASYEELSNALSTFELKQYELSELIEMLIRHYSASGEYTEIIIMHQQLFKIFNLYGLEKESFSVEDTLFPTKRNSLRQVKELYLSKEFGTKLTEELYHYDKHKIIAPISKFSIENNMSDRWKKYLLWLGIAEYPRFVQVRRENDYAQYTMKRFNFKNTVDGKAFTGGYAQFANDLSSYGGMAINSLDDLENLLKNNPSEKILQLINDNSSLAKYLEEDKESKDSYLNFNFHYAKKTFSIRGAQLRSFLLWKLRNTAWITTESGKRYLPINCSSAAYINDDFRGLVEKPLFDTETLRKCGIGRDKVEYLSSLVGIHKTINTFSTELLYSILSFLPEIDPSGKKTKTIYNQLSVNFEQIDSLDISESNYQNYHRTGKVLCKNGEFMPLKEVYYVNDKRYGDSITARFNTIEIERRRGKEKIRKLFGVHPLDELDLSIQGEPDGHKLNSAFITELEAFKPYVYVLRKDMDNGNEKNIIKEIKFTLVSSLTLLLQKGDDAETVILNDYEYFYDKRKRTVFVNSHQQYFDITDLKEDIHMCSCIAEAFAAILDVDSHRMHIRELFSKSSAVRDDLLRSELDDNSLQKLNAAKTILGVASDPRIDFWKAFAQCSKKKKLIFKTVNDSELLEFLLKSFPQQSQSISESFGIINYNDPSDIDSCESIASLLKSMGADIPKMNEFLYPPLDISLLYKLSFKAEVEKRLGDFTAHLYRKAEAENSNQQNFLGLMDRYNLLDGFAINSIIYEDAAIKDFNSKILTDFGIDMSAPAEAIDLAFIYEKNTASLFLKHDVRDNEKTLFKQFLHEQHSYYSMMYFPDNIDAVHSAFSLWVGKKEGAPSPTASPGKRISFGKTSLLYNDLSDLKSQIDEMIADNDLSGITTALIKTSPAIFPNRTPGKPGGRINRSGKTQKEEIGFIGEYIVYKYLLKTITDKSSIKWVSEYAKQCGVNPLGGDGYGYDLHYIPNNAKHRKYVEVKVVGWEDAFHIYPNEIQFGEANKQHHELFLIRNIENPFALRIERIQNLFDYKGKSFTSNDSFTVLNDSYIIKFTKK